MIAPPPSVQVKVPSTAPLIVTWVSDNEKPVPSTVTVAPTTPVVGDSAMLGVVSWNVAVAVSGAPPRTFPTAVIVYAPGMAEPTVNVQIPVIVPPLSVQMKVASTPPLMETCMSNDENPIPLTVTVSPTTPVVGERVMLAVVSLNVAVAVSAGTPSVPTAVIV